MEQVRLGPLTLFADGHRAECVAGSDPMIRAVRNDGGRPIVLADPTAWRLTIIASGDGRDCGELGRRSRRDLETDFTLEALAAGPVTARFTDNDGTDEVVEVTNVVFE